MFTFVPNAWKIAARAVSELLASGSVLLPEQVGVPNGVAGLDADGNIVATPIHRFGTAAAINAVVLKSGEIAFTTDTLEWRRGDGETGGGSFLAGQPMSFTGGPTELSSASGDSIAIVHPTVAGGIYRIWGDIGFGGDTDNQSNFRFSFQHSSGLVTAFPTLSSFHVSMLWASGTGTVTPDMRLLVPASLPQFPTLIATPVNTSASSGFLRIDATLATNAAANITMGMRLRTAKLGTPTILAAYRLFVQRIK